MSYGGLKIFKRFQKTFKKLKKCTSVSETVCKTNAKCVGLPEVCNQSGEWKLCLLGTTSSDNESGFFLDQEQLLHLHYQGCIPYGS